MTRQEKIEHIAGLVYVNIPKYNYLTDYKLPEEVLHTRTINELEKLSDEELDIVTDNIWNTIKNICDNHPLPEFLDRDKI